MVETGKHSKRYLLQGLVLVAILFAAGWIVDAYVATGLRLMTPLLVCSGYALIVEIAEAILWSRFSNKPADEQPNFFTGVSVIRMLTAMAVVFVYFLQADKAGLFQFFLMFAIFYFAILLHHLCFFFLKGKRDKSKI